MSDKERPKTGRELYKILMENGLIGMWKDRTDIGDSVEYARKLRDGASKRDDNSVSLGRKVLHGDTKTHTRTES